MADTGVTDITLCGPSNLIQFVESMRHFVYRTKLSLHVKEFSTSNDIFDDGTLKAIPILIEQDSDNNSNNILNYNDMNMLNNSMNLKNSTTIIYDKNTGFYKVNLKSDFESIKYRITPPTCNMNTVVCYALHTPNIPGKFDAKIASSLGIPPGPLRGKLVKGERVVLENGKIVEPSDCISPEQRGPIVLVIHCPDQSYLGNLITHEGFSPYMNGGEFFEDVQCILHMTNDVIFNSEVYSSFVKCFNFKAQHIVISKELCKQEIVFRASAYNHMKLHYIDPIIFPKPYFDYKPTSVISDSLYESLNVQPASSLMVYHLLPTNIRGIDRSNCIEPLNFDEIQESMKKDPKVNELLSKLEKYEQELDNFDLLFLGTGSAIPSQYRNVSGIHVKLKDSNQGFFLDAGEGSFGQLYRIYGKNVNSIIDNTNFAFISHMHADHHLGLIRVLCHRSKDAIPMTIVGPSPLLLWLEEYKQIEDIQFNFIDIELFTQANQSMEDVKRFIAESPFEEIVSAHVLHCPLAYGISLKHKSKWKITFSGDTRPISSLEEIGKDSTLLIHEATFEDDLQSEAVDKFHSTTSEAIKTALNMNVKYLIMNHFSQRYPKIPKFDEQYKHFVSVAMDYMIVSPNKIKPLTNLLDCMKYIFEKGEKEEELMEDIKLKPENKKMKIK